MATLPLQEFFTRTNEDWRFVVSLANARDLAGAVATMMVKTEAASSDDMLDLSSADSPTPLALDAGAKTLTGLVSQLQMSEFVPGSYVFDVVITYADDSVSVEANCKLSVIKGVTDVPRPEAISVLGDGPLLLS